MLFRALMYIYYLLYTCTIYAYFVDGLLSSPQAFATHLLMDFFQEFLSSYQKRTLSKNLSLSLKMEQDSVESKNICKVKYIIYYKYLLRKKMEIINVRDL